MIANRFTINVATTNGAGSQTSNNMLIYIEPDTPSFNELLNTVDMPLSQLSEAQLRPSREALRKLKAKFE